MTKIIRKLIFKKIIAVTSLIFVSSVILGSVISCSKNNESSSKTNNSTNKLYEPNAQIITTLLPALFPKTINVANINDETAINVLSNQNSMNQLESSIKSALIQSMNNYVSNQNNIKNPTVLTVSGTNYTASEIATNLTINFPSVTNLVKNYSYDATTLNDVTFSYDNCPINFTCTISGFAAPINIFLINNLQNLLHPIDLSNWNETIPQSLSNKTSLLNAIEQNIEEQLSNNLNKLVINNIALTPSEIMNNLIITLPNTINYSNGELENLYASILILNSTNAPIYLSISGFSKFNFTNTFWQTVSNELQTTIDKSSNNALYLSNYSFTLKQTLSSSNNSKFNQALINCLLDLNIPTNFIVNNISFNVIYIIQEANYILPKNLTQAQIASDETDESISNVVLNYNNINVTLPIIYLNTFN